MGILFPVYGDAPSPCGRITWSQRGIGRPPARLPCAAAFWVAMRPSAFLMLSTPLPVPRSSLAWLAARAGEAAGLFPPSLDVWLGGGSTPAVVRHDGRHRATLALGLCGEAEIPVMLRFRGPGASRAAAPSLLARARQGMLAQGSATAVAGSLFGEASDECDGGHAPGIPPPGARGRTPTEMTIEAEEPGIRVAQKAGLNREILDTAPSASLNMLSYKAENAGAVMVRVNTRKHRPSQTDPMSGEVRKKPSSQRTHTLPDGRVTGRDHAAAWVILNVAMPCGPKLRSPWVHPWGLSLAPISG